MTTIVVRDRVLATDSVVWHNDICIGTSRKGGKSSDGGLWGGAGQAHLIESFRVWLEGDRAASPPEWECNEHTGAEVLVVAPDGKVRAWEGKGWVEVTAPFYAIGSGSHIALGAMHMGATAQQAVEAAANFDAFTGGEVKVFTLAPFNGESPPPAEAPQDWTETVQPPEAPPNWREELGLK